MRVRVGRQYSTLLWVNATKREPRIFICEVDVHNQRLGLRSSDIFVDGHTCNIADLYDGAIEVTPIPTVEAFNNHVWGEEFHACTIDRAEFENTWDNQSYCGTFLK